MVRTFLWVVCGAVLGLGCAGIKAQQRQEVRSPGINVTQDGEHLRGEAFRRPVDLTIASDRVGGEYGRMVADLHVIPQADGTRMDGELRGQAVVVHFSDERIEGVLGGCVFSLQSRGEGTFAGPRRCGHGEIETYVVALPAHLAGAPMAERAAWTAVLLSDTPAQSIGGAGMLVSFAKERKPRR